MIESLQITNFRCFETLTLAGFSTINIIVGDNSAGKTALLEAIFLAQVGTPEAALRLRVWRSLGSTMVSPQTRGAYEAFWKDLFFQFHQQRSVEIFTKGTQENTRSLKIFYDPDESPAVPVSPINGATGVITGRQSDSTSIIPVTFQYTDSTNAARVYKPTLPFLQVTGMGSGPPQPAPVAFFSSSFATVVLPSEVADQFSQLDKKNKTGPIGTALRKIYPRIRRLSVQTENGSALLYCDAKGLSEKVPVAIESSGTHKLAAILLGMASQPHGVVLIDEIENGFYYNKMPEIWRALLGFCKSFKVQLFITTHSKECLSAALPMIQENEDRFRLIRLENKNGNRIATLFRGKEFEAALETDIEFR